MHPLLLCLYRRRKKKATRPRRYYVRPAHLRPIAERFTAFYANYRSTDPNDLFRYLRFEPDQFDDLYDLVEDYMKNSKITHRYPISKIERLAVYLR